jgi:hypothetical protein
LVDHAALAAEAEATKPAEAAPDRSASRESAPQPVRKNGAGSYGPFSPSVASIQARQSGADAETLRGAIDLHARELESCASVLTGTYRLGKDLVLGPVSVVLDLGENGRLTDKTRSKTSEAFLAPVADCVLRIAKGIDFSRLSLRAPQSMPVVVDVDCQVVDKGRETFSVKCAGKYRRL